MGLLPKAPQGKEFQEALAFAQNSSYDVVRYERRHACAFAIGVAYWNMSNYR